MIINIYYGGRGLIEDPTIYVVNKLKETLEEIRVRVNLYNLYEHKSNITALVNTLKDVDGIVLAANVEWLGIGGYMQQFLDACWLYADKEKLSNIYLMPTVISTTYGEGEAMSYIVRAWEVLGGIVLPGICSYVENQIDFETNKSYANMIEKKAEQFYRFINQQKKGFPSSNSLFKKKILKIPHELTPQESEQLSQYVSDDRYVKKQKEDIEELTEIFKDIIEKEEQEVDSEYDYVYLLKKNFNPISDFQASYGIHITDLNKTIIIDIDSEKLNCKYGQKDEVDVFAKISKRGMDKLVEGSTSFQQAFMTGELTAKGNFKTLRKFDQAFLF